MRRLGREEEGSLATNYKQVILRGMAVHPHREVVKVVGSAVEPLSTGLILSNRVTASARPVCNRGPRRQDELPTGLDGCGRAVPGSVRVLMRQAVWHRLLPVLCGLLLNPRVRELMSVLDSLCSVPRR